MPWYAWVTIVAIVMVFGLAMLQVWVRGRGTPEAQELRRDIDALAGENRDLRGRVEALERRGSVPPAPPAPPAAGP